ncbi:MAG: HD domain-containing protein [Bacilli bacterium]|nr:HD domain-containing protein [Bacilli bacterium]
MEYEFTKYIETFDKNERMIKLKYNHSLRVKDNCINIAKSEKLDNEQIELAKVIGLLHDYGRFAQWEKHHTFKDYSSFDHADYGVQKLFDENEIEKYWAYKKDYKIIYDAIKNHNKYSLPEDIGESALMSKIVRDADKLDILYLYTVGELTFKNEGEITKEIETVFYNHKQIKNQKMISKADWILWALALVYDLNFNYSYKYLKENKIIEKIYEKIKNKTNLQKYFDEINIYINKKLEVIKC